jgi:hypothetical protein
VIPALLALLTTAACNEVGADEHALAAHGRTDEAQSLAAEVTPTVPVEALFEGRVVYLGLDVDPPKLTPGDRVVISQYWRLTAALSASDRATFGRWTTFLQVEAPYGRGAIVANRTAPANQLALDRWPVGTVVKEEFVLHVPEDWSEPAVWLFTGIGADSNDAYATDALRVMRGPDDDGWRVRALTIRVKRPSSGGLPSWVTQIDHSQLSKLVE